MCVSRLVRFAHACVHVGDFNERSVIVAFGLLLLCHRLRGCLCGFCYCGLEFVGRYNFHKGTLVDGGVSHPVFCGNVVYGLCRALNSNRFSSTFSKIVMRHIKLG